MPGDAIAVIPARLCSTRLPRKVLLEVGGRPLLRHVWDRLNQVKRISAVYVATDSTEVFEAVTAWGGCALMTSSHHDSGTARIASIIDQIGGEFILNVQADEPFIDPRMLDSLLDRWIASPTDLITWVFPIRDIRVLFDPNVVKVARAADGRALYFSRSVIPFVRDVNADVWLQHSPFWGHVGMYGYRRQVLQNFSALPRSPLEESERLEQLRFLDAGYCMQTVEISSHQIGVDTPSDLERVRGLYAERFRDLARDGGLSL